MHVESLGKARYFIEFIDDSSRWCEVRFLKSKSEVLKVTKEYVAMLENQQGIKVKCLQSDNGGEYTSHDFDEYLKERGIRRLEDIIPSRVVQAVRESKELAWREDLENDTTSEPKKPRWQAKHQYLVFFPKFH